MHLHELIQGHVRALKFLEICAVKNISKGLHDNVDLGVVQAICRKLILVFEVF